MRWFNWMEAYRQKPLFTENDILAAVDKLEHAYWPWLIFALTLHTLGFTLMVAGFFLSTRVLIAGGILVLDSSILIATLKIVAHVRLQGLWGMWQAENRLKAELRRIDASEL